MEETWDEWRERQEAKQAKSYQQLGEEKKLPAAKRPTTEEEQKLICALAACHFAPATWDKSFAHSLHGFDATTRAVTPVAEISEKQAYWLFKLTAKYRRQMGLSEDQANEYRRRAESMLTPNSDQH